jgi:flavodoxin
MKSIVVYYSWTGNTEIVAKELANQLKADIRSLKEQKVRKDAAGFMRAALGALTGAKSRLLDTDYSLDNYDIVLLGTPIWAFHTTPALNTFVKNADFHNKTIYLFSTTASGKIEKPYKPLAKRVRKQGGTVAGKFYIQTEYNKELELEDVKSKIKDWATKIAQK